MNINLYSENNDNDSCMFNWQHRYQIIDEIYFCKNDDILLYVVLRFALCSRNLKNVKLRLTMWKINCHLILHEINFGKI